MIHEGAAQWTTRPQQFSFGFKYGGTTTTKTNNGDIYMDFGQRIGRNEPVDGKTEALVCFRVRTQEGHEITLVHDPAGDGWQVRN